MKGHNDEVFVVFGGAGEIGHSLFCDYLSQWKDVRFVVADKDHQKLEELKNKAGPSVKSCLVADATNFDQVNKVFDTIKREHGPKVAGVVNLVGDVVRKPLADTSPQEFEDILNLNLVSAFNILHRGVKELLTSDCQDRSIVMVTGAASQFGVKHHEAWAAAKAGVEGLVRCAAATYAPQGIRMNVVAPALTSTAAAKMPEAAQEKSAKLYPFKRLATTAEVASCVEFMMCPHRSSYVNGQVLNVDAGMSTISAHETV